MSEPPFYRRPVALSRDAHGEKRYVAPAGFGYAAATNAVPLGAVEAESAARHYPIVFAAADPGGLIALLGVETGRNLFVDGSGDWRPGSYIPAYVRRYPFAFAQVGDQLVLCVDEAADAIGDIGDPLFVDGKPAPLVAQALAFSREFQVQADAAQAFAAACATAGLLADHRAEFALNDGRKIVLGGFRILDRAKFDTLPDAAFIDWRKRGWLALAYAHFQSMQSWANLIDRASMAA
ncbi:MAG: SapC family protein [Rhodospirillales bacterium]|nr:SapC family protein [Rhodospirillales bacterium]